MTLEEAKALLIASQSWSLDEAKMRADEIERAFRVFWASRPDENEFVRTIGHVLLTARMLYMIAAMPRP